MDVSNSQLFKNFARPVLQQQQQQQQHNSRIGWLPWTPGIMDAIVQYLFNRAKMRLVLTRITDATEDSFTSYVEAKVSGTGPVSSVVSPEELDFTFDGAKMARFEVPGIRTSFLGTDVVVPDQRVRITDMAAFKAYVRSVMVADETAFGLRNGRCTINALGITAHCDYNLDVPMMGMSGPRVTVKELRRDGRDVTFVVTAHNPSPVEIDHGMCHFEVREGGTKVIAELTGHLRVLRGDFEVVLKGGLAEGVAPESDDDHAFRKLFDRTRVVGVRTEGNSWLNETIQYIDIPIKLDSK